MQQGPGTVVFVIDGEGSVRPVPVTTGSGVGEWIEVDGSVEPGQQVVTRGNERLFPGQPVTADPIEYPLP